MNSHTERLHAVVSVILLLASGLLGYWQLRGRLHTSRPPEKDAGALPAVGPQRVTARLWEDPVAAVDRLDGDGATPWADMRDEVVRSGPGTVVLGVFVEGTPYPEDVEVRLRRRYAVGMAVLGSGFAPRDRTHIGFLDVPWPDMRRDLGGNTVQAGLSATNRLRVPYEWYDSKAGAGPSVLVTWLREEHFADHPMTRLGCLLTHLSERRSDTWRLCVIGPRSSDTLRAMAREQPLDILDRRQQHWRPNDYRRRLGIFSPEASVPDPMLLRGWTNQWQGPRQAMAQTLSRGLGSNIFHNLIATDDQLAQLIVRDIGLRGGCVALGAPKWGAEDHVAMVSESDTFYGRSLPAAIQAATLASQTNETYRLRLLNGLAAGRIQAPSNVLVYGYLRGLDGRRADPPDPSQTTEPNPSTPEAAVASMMRRISEISKGEAQFDYAARLAERLAQRDAELRRRGAGRIVAVGLGGSDLYDKLILLQALRPRLGKALFFTTDLDARLWDVENLPYTRNLLVASAYGLQPADGDSRPPPPFRDSYQTAVYQACRAALGSPVPAIPPLPRLFEIGRYGPVPLSNRAGATAVEERSRPGWKAVLGPCLLMVVGMTLVLTILFRDFDSGSLRRTEMKLIVLGIVAFVGVSWWFYSVANDLDEEPWRLFEGVSVWPTEIVRVFTAVLTGVLLVGAYLEHRDRRTRLWTTYFAPRSKTRLPIPRWRHVWRQVRRSPWNYLRGATSYALSNCLDNEGRLVAQKLFRQYVQRALAPHRGLRVLPQVLGYVVVALGVVLLTGGMQEMRENAYIRGEFARKVDSCTLLVTVLLFLILLFYTLDAAWLTTNLLRRPPDCATTWPNAILDESAAQHGLAPQHLEGWLDVQFAADKTREISQLMFLPFLTLLLILLARSSYFDKWAWPPGLVVVFFMNFFVAGSSWCCLRSAAKKLRDSALRRLDRNIRHLDLRVPGEPCAAPGSPPNLTNASALKRLGKLRSEIVNERRGAYSKLIQDPTMVALLIPTGVSGILAVILRQLAGGN